MTSPRSDQLESTLTFCNMKKYEKKKVTKREPVCKTKFKVTPCLVKNRTDRKNQEQQVNRIS